MDYQARKISRAVRKAIRSTLNKTMRSAQTAAGKAVRQVYNIKAKDLKQRTVTRRATDQRLFTSFYVRGRVLPLRLFAARQVRKGTTVKVKRRGKRKLIKSAFLATMPNGVHTNVFQREGRKRLPIKSLKTADPATMYRRAGMSIFERMIMEKANITFQSELRFFVNRVIGK